jgi:hypothetical protein
MKPMTMINQVATLMASGEEFNFTAFGQSMGAQAELDDDGLIKSWQKWSVGSGVIVANFGGGSHTPQRAALELLKLLVDETHDLDNAEDYEPHRKEFYNFMDTEDGLRLWPASERYNEEE